MRIFQRCSSYSVLEQLEEIIMSKFRLLSCVSLLIIASMLLAACAPTATEVPPPPTAAPATEAPVVTEAPATEAPIEPPPPAEAKGVTFISNQAFDPLKHPYAQ